MKVTVTLDDDLVKKVRKIAAERGTTLTGMVREYIEKTAAVEAASGRKSRERAALERSFETIQVHIGERTWNRADLYVRS
jgi:predicted transcriptional regulator